MKLKEAMRKHNITVIELAKKLDLNTSQIYRWQREGINLNNKHFYKLRELMPELTPNEVKLRKDGETEDLRYKSGRTKKEVITVEEDEVYINQENTHSAFKSSLFPKIKIKKKENN